MAKPLGISSLFIPNGMPSYVSFETLFEHCGENWKRQMLCLWKYACIRRMPSYDLNVTNL